AMIVEPSRLIFGDAGGEDLGLPGAGRGLEAFELAEDGGERVGALNAALLRDALPFEQEGQEIARRDRLDLGAQALQCAAMDAGEEAAFAPFVIVSPGIDAGGEAAAQRKALCLEGGERGGDVGRREAERRGERGFGNGAEPFKSAAQDFDERFLGRPVLFVVPAGRGDRRVEMCVREQREELRQPLGGDPQLRRYSLSARLSPMGGGGEGWGEVGDSGTFDRAHL